MPDQKVPKMLQPLNANALASCSMVSWSALPDGNDAVHAPGHSIPSGLEVTRPQDAARTADDQISAAAEQDIAALDLDNVLARRRAC